MKMVKSLLLGSAAGLVAVTSGQAADLPVKAKPVEYVRVCNLYGAGFYYMPGTDLCLKIGGWVRAEAVFGTVNGSVTWGPFNGNANNRGSSMFAYRARGYITADAREQTAYGTARGYIAVGVNTNDTGLYGSPAVPPSTFSANRAFVQWAGMTAGISQSFFDFYSVPAAQYRGGYVPASDTGDPGWMVWGYTAQFGNGLSATVSAEARRTAQIIYQNGAQPITGFTGPSGTIVPGGYFNTLSTNAGTTTGFAADSTGGGSLFAGNGAYGGMQAPDVVANLRLDQAWGGAQIMGALHDLNTSYYGASASAATPATALSIAAPVNGHPSDQLGWAVGAGLKVNFPAFGPGDYFQGQVNYTEGALRYLFFTPNSNWGIVYGNTEAYGVMSDCVYGGTLGAGTTTGCEKTTAWGFNASYEHYWTPQWHESFYGEYYAVNYDAAANNMLCTIAGMGTGSGTAAAATGACNNNWSTWGVGSRLQWDVTKTFYLGVEVLYEQLKSATPAGGTGGALGGYAFGSATVQTSTASSWMVSVRAHKDFLP